MSRSKPDALDKLKDKMFHVHYEKINNHNNSNLENKKRHIDNEHHKITIISPPIHRK